MGNEAKQRRIKYLMFCKECGYPKHLPKFVLKHIIPSEAVEGIFCDDCGLLNEIPDYLKKVSKDLAEGDLKYYG